MSVKCCFCDRELPNRYDRHNPEPLNQDPPTVCCAECNKDYVVPVRHIVWRSWVTNEERRQVLDYFQSMSLEELKTCLLKNNMINNFEDYQAFLKTLPGGH